MMMSILKKKEELRSKRKRKGIKLIIIFQIKSHWQQITGDKLVRWSGISD